MTTVIKLQSGRYLDIENPLPELIDLEDIATPLSHLCRFTGHVPRFYSVAEHSVLVAAIAYAMGEPPAVVYAATLHDAPEAYIGDVSTPLKTLLFPIYHQIDTKLRFAINKRFDISAEQFARVHKYDMIALAVEKRLFFPDDTEQWECLREVVVPRFIWQICKSTRWGWTPHHAREQFLRAVARNKTARDRANWKAYERSRKPAYLRPVSDK